jgi:hypothetical protein
VAGGDKRKTKELMLLEQLLRYRPINPDCGILKPKNKLGARYFEKPRPAEEHKEEASLGDIQTYIYEMGPLMK